MFSVAFAGGSSEVYIPIDGSPLIARFFRLVALSANTANVFAMRLELHGCTVSSDYAFVGKLYVLFNQFIPKASFYSLILAHLDV